MSSSSSGGESDRALIVLLLVVVLAAVAYNMIVSAKVAQALRNVDAGLKSGSGELGGFRQWLQSWGLW